MMPLPLANPFLTQPSVLTFTDPNDGVHHQTMIGVGDGGRVKEIPKSIASCMSLRQCTGRNSPPI